MAFDDAMMALEVARARLLNRKARSDASDQTQADISEAINLIELARQQLIQARRPGAHVVSQAKR